VKVKRLSEASLLKKIKDILSTHKGEKNGITSRAMADLLGIVEGDTFIRTRGLIDKAVRVYELPIAATTNGGYFFITRPNELFAYMVSLERRVFEIKNKRRLVYKNYVKLYGEPITGREGI
jgi:hypothetical protein